jgi:hypothetical protein
MQLPGLGLDIRVTVVFSGKDKRFFSSTKRTDRDWGPHKLVLIPDLGPFSRHKAAGQGHDRLPPSSIERYHFPSYIS